MVLLEEEMAVTLLVVGFLEVRILLERQLIVFFCPLEVNELDIDLSDVAVVLSHFRISPHCFFVLFQSLGEFA